MIKSVLKVPKGVRYISDWLEYDLSNFKEPHIFNKQITGCGFTEYCIRAQKKIILCSPRCILLEDKEQQHPDEVMYVKNELDRVINFDKDSNSNKATSNSYSPEVNEDVRKRQIEALKNSIKSYYEKCLVSGGSFNYDLPVKYLVTYDSFRLVKEALKEIGVFEEFYVVVDEFQSIFTDSRFKSSTEIEFLGQLSDVRNLCFVSATPMLDKYLGMLEEFKDLPYYELDWATEDPSRVLNPQLTTRATDSILSEANRIVKSYLDGDFEKASWRDEATGRINEIESKEAVIYVNSVKNICDIISRNKLKPENTNVLCSKTPENEKKVRKAFGLKAREVGGIGSVPKKDEPHKMFTLCTRTVYLGADFYSTNARSFVLSDANVDCLAVDITLDLPQILGRQRLDLNPWKNRAELYFKIKNRIKSVEEFKALIETKKKSTASLLRTYEAAGIEDKQAVAEKYERDGTNYRRDYVAINRHAGSMPLPVFNNLVLVSEIRTYEVQQIDYKDRFTVFNTLAEKNKVETDKLNQMLVYFDHELPTFIDKMRFVCQAEFETEEARLRFLRLIPQEYENYYLSLGPEKISAASYRRGRLKVEYDRLKKNQEIDIKEVIYRVFEVGIKYTKAQIKDLLGKVYLEVGYNKTPKASDLLDYFKLKDCKMLNSETGKWDNAFEIVSKKEGD